MTMTSTKPHIAVLGIGRMGAAIARSLLKAGYAANVWNRTPGRAAALVADGAKTFGEPAGAIAASDAVITLLTDYPMTDTVLRTPEAAAALRGKTLIQSASGSPRQARETARWAAQNDVRYLDVAIIAPPPFVGTPECTVFAAGDADAFARHEAMLRVIGGNTKFFGTDAGHAAVMDSALLAYFWGHQFGVLLAADVSRTERIPLARLGEEIRALAPVVLEGGTDFLNRLQTGHFTETDATLDVHHGAMQHLLEIVRDNGIDPAIPKAFAEAIRRAIDAGNGALDFAAISKTLETKRN